VESLPKIFIQDHTTTGFAFRRQSDVGVEPT